MTWIIEIKNKNIEILSQLPEKRKEVLMSHINKLNTLSLEINFVDEINDAYNEYTEYLNDKNMISRQLVRYINNYLSSYKSFIDKWETYLKRNKSSDFVQFFKESLSTIYDEHFEYRFLYNLRNFSQHNGTPVSEISKSLDKGTRVILSKESFLKNHRNMQPKFKVELNNIPINDLNVSNAIIIVHQQLLKLNNMLCNKQLEFLNVEYLIASVNVMQFYNEYNKNQGDLALSDFNKEDFFRMSEGLGQVAIKMIKIPTLLAKTIIGGAYIKFKFKGRHIGSINGFPEEYISKTEILKVPTFKTGSEDVIRNGVRWIRVVDSTGFNYRDGYDRYFAVYFPIGLTIKDYEERAKMFDDEMRKLFKY